MSARSAAKGLAHVSATQELIPTKRAVGAHNLSRAATATRCDSGYKYLPGDESKRLSIECVVEASDKCSKRTN